MDIVIKNIESLRNDIYGHTQTPPKRVVVDFSKAGTDEFAQLFFDACDDIKMSDLCAKCKNYRNGEKTVNCRCYITPEFSCYEEKLKEVTSRMQSEFDATGKDVAYFMNHRVKPGGINND